MLKHDIDIIRESHHHICYVKSTSSQNDRINYEESFGRAFLRINNHNDFENSKMIPKYSDRSYIILNINPEIKDYIKIPAFDNFNEKQDFHQYMVIETDVLTPLDISKVNPKNNKLLERISLNIKDVPPLKPKDRDRSVENLQKFINFIYDTMKTGHDHLPYSV